jgi:hypothetical protein
LTGRAAVHPDAAPAAAVLLSSWSTEHAWHAELWADRLPVTAAIDAEALVVLPAPLPEILARVASAAPLAQLAALIRFVLPRLVITYERHLATASAVSEGPTRRALALVVRDEREAWEAGEALVQGLLTDEEAVVAAGQAVVELEQRLVAAGGGWGLLVPSSGSRA